MDYRNFIIESVLAYKIKRWIFKYLLVLATCELIIVTARKEPCFFFILSTEPKCHKNLTIWLNNTKIYWVSM